MDALDMSEFRAYLKVMSDRQLLEVYEKEKTAGRLDYVELVIAECESRGKEIWVL